MLFSSSYFFFFLSLFYSHSFFFSPIFFLHESFYFISWFSVSHFFVCLSTIFSFFLFYFCWLFLPFFISCQPFSSYHSLFLPHISSLLHSLIFLKVFALQYWFFIFKIKDLIILAIQNLTYYHSQFITLTYYSLTQICIYLFSVFTTVHLMQS